nr:GDSL esterase/lipase At5g45950 [Tanacetum cinerariifolium]
MESLHLSFFRAVEAGIFTGIKIDSSLTLSHLFYADDADESIAKLKKKLSKWKLKTLSVGGRLTLLKTVLGSTPSYIMSLFKVPKQVLNSMERMRMNFFNGVQEGERKIAWVKWSKVLAFKKFGGLGVSSFFALNRALIFKWVWRFLSHDNFLWFLVISALHGSNLMAFSTSYSSIWSTIIKEVNSLKVQGVDLLSHSEALGYTKEIRPYLEAGSPTAFDLSHGVSFASSASGYDNFTAQVSNVLTLSHQLKYFAHYKRNLSMNIGANKAAESINNAVFVLSMGTNDFLQNYYVEPTRSSQYTIDQYEDYLVSLFQGYIKKMHRLGARRLAVVGVVPFGCFVETSKGCCGTGTFEYGITCKGLDACADRERYLFWDAVHPSDKMYKILADEALSSLIINLF